MCANLNRLSPQDEEGFGSLCQETSEFVDQYMFNFVGLLNFYAHPNAIDAGFDEDLLILVSRDGQRIQKHLRRACGFNLGHIVSL